MGKIGFDNQKYLELQSKHIRERIEKFGGKLYLEFGGKLFDDYHASRVLPGFAPDSKLQMLLQLKDEAEVLIAINSSDIEKNKVRGDLGITYDLDVLRLIDAFRAIGLYVGSVVLTRYESQPAAVQFAQRLESLGVKVFRHYSIPGYPHNIEGTMGEDGFGRNEYVETTRELVIVTAPGPGSGKMATCMSQLYHENKRGVKAGYAKFETFPIWNIPLRHPVNMAYEAATADLNDVNMIDPFHLEAYGKMAVNYNRDVEVFPVVDAMFRKIYGDSPYHSPTDMGVNMVGNCIIDDEVVREASRQEIIRRYFAALCEQKENATESAAVGKIELLMQKAEISVSDRACVEYANKKADLTDGPAAAIELPNGEIITGKTSSLLGASAALILNALKALAGIDDKVELISPSVIRPVQHLKVDHLGNHNPRLHVDEILIALAISAVSSKRAALALEQLDNLKGLQAHSSVILSSVDKMTFKKLGVDMTCEPKYQVKKLYHAK